MASLAMIVAFLSLDLVKETAQLQQHKLVVYAVNKHSIIELVSGRQSVMLVDEPIETDDPSYTFHIAPNQYAMDVQPMAQECLPEHMAAFHAPPFNRQGDYIQLLNKRIVILSQYQRMIQPAHRLRVNYLILTDNVKLDMEDIRKLYDFDLVIFDASNSKAKADSWAGECKDFGLPYYNVHEQGAFVTDLPIASASSQ
jgi:hypothetical protein